MTTHGATDPGILEKSPGTVQSHRSVPGMQLNMVQRRNLSKVRHCPDQACSPRSHFGVSSVVLGSGIAVPRTVSISTSSKC